MSDVECPYCGADIEICHDDGFGYEEDLRHEYECPECEKMFVFTTSISIYHEAFSADCLNDAEHKWKLSCTYPRKHSRWICEDCDAEKPATREEIEAVYPDAFDK